MENQSGVCIETGGLAHEAHSHRPINRLERANLPEDVHWRAWAMQFGDSLVCESCRGGLPINANEKLAVDTHRCKWIEKRIESHAFIFNSHMDS